MADEKVPTSFAPDHDIEKEISLPLDGKRRTSAPTTEILKHSRDADEAMKAFEGSNGEIIHIDEATNKRLLRKIDLHIMPLLCIVYGLNYLDKTTLSYANVMGIKTDIGLKADDYQWLGSMFYFGRHHLSHTISAFCGGWLLTQE